MAKIKPSWPRNNYKSTENTGNTFTHLKQSINVNVKNLRTFKWDILLILSLIFIIIFLMTFMVSDRIFSIKTVQNYETFEEKQYKKFDGKLINLETRINNIMLKLKYTEQNINSIRLRHILSTDYSESESESESSPCNSANPSEIENDYDSNTTSELDNSTSSASVQLLDHQSNELKSNISKTLDIYPTSPIRISENNLTDNESKIEELSRQKRTTLSQKQNHTITENERNGDDTADIQRKSRARKSRRNKGRGRKQKTKGRNEKEKDDKRRRHKRNNKRLGPALATFIGAIPEQTFKDTVYIGPWIKSNKSNGSYNFEKFYLSEKDYSIEVNMSGLYMISVQIFYFGKPISHSYWVLLNSEGSSAKQKLITCATGSIASEVSCYTGVTTYLQKGDRLSILQQERNRFVNMREGYSQVQLVLLANDED